MDRHKRNLLVLDQIFVRASRPEFWGKITLQFENGVLRNQFKIENNLRVGDKPDEEIGELLDASMVSGDIPADG